MIFWKEYNLRFACISCTKGHRSAKCSHLKRQLQEVKQKGRPATQCPSCRIKREIGRGHAHHKCKCGSNPPMRFVKKYNIIFDEGLELIFDALSNFDISIFRERINHKQPIELTVVKDKKEEEMASFLAKDFKITEEEVDVKPSPTSCQCHFGGECICSTMPQERKRKSKSIQKELGGCACSGGCCSGRAQCCGPMCGCVRGGTCDQPLQTNFSNTVQQSAITEAARSCCAMPQLQITSLAESSKQVSPKIPQLQLS